jgi:hypothetical protein
MYQLEAAGLIDDETKKINDISWFFAPGNWQRIDRSDTGGGWTWIYVMDPGCSWFGVNPSSPLDYGSGAFNLVVLADITGRNVYTYECDDNQQRNDCNSAPPGVTCQDLNGDGDCNDRFRTTEYEFRAGPPDRSIAELDNKVDPYLSWNGHEMRSVILYDAYTNPGTPRWCDVANNCWTDTDSDGYPEVDINNNRLSYGWNTRNQPLVGYRIW